MAHVLTTRDEDLARTFCRAASGVVKVPVLDDATAWELLQSLAPEACAADPAAARSLADAVGGLPLAVKLVGGYLAASEHWRFSDLSQAALRELGDPRRRLALAQARLGDASGAQQTLEAVVKLSVDDLARLGEAGARANRAFYALAALAPKPAVFDLAAADVVADAAASALALLAGRNLLEVGAGEWMAIHQVVHDVALTQMPPEAIERHRAHYLALVNEDREDWQRIERAFPQVQHAWRGLSNDDDRVIEFVWALRVYFERRGLGADHLAWADRASQLAQSRHDDRVVATLLNNIGLVYSALGDKPKALDYYEQALPLRRQVGDRWGESVTRFNMAMVFAYMGDLARAEDELRQVVAIDETVGHPDLASDRAALAQVQALRRGGAAAT